MFDCVECSIVVGDGQNMDLNLGISITIDGPKGNYDKGAGESQTHSHPPLHHASGKWPLVRYSNITLELIRFIQMN